MLNVEIHHSKKDMIQLTSIKRESKLKVWLKPSKNKFSSILACLNVHHSAKDILQTNSKNRIKTKTILGFQAEK